jgi:hypothetical protein
MFDKIPLILNGVDLKEHLFQDPYPHIVIENALTKEEVEFFRSQKNRLSVFKNNFYGNYRTDYSMPPSDFTDFFNKLCDVFGVQHFKQDTVRYGKKIVNKNDINVMSVLSVYHQDKIANKISDHTPLGPHRDLEQKMFVCLLYLAAEEDNAGGDLLLYEATASDKKHRTDVENIKLSKTIAYAPGTLVIFLNGQRSIHAVGERLDSPYDRAMICITFETNRKDWMKNFIPSGKL